MDLSSWNLKRFVHTYNILCSQGIYISVYVLLWMVGLGIIAILVLDILCRKNRDLLWFLQKPVD